jgi:three-Cys-motif partner protein
VNVKHPWSGYVFSDLSEMCVAALRARTAGRSDVHVLQGDANSAALLDEIAGTVPRHALVCLYADPEGLDLHLGTIRFFAERYQHLDLLLNVPVAGVVRYLAAGGESKAVPVLGHSDPAALLREGKGRHFGPDVRVWYQRQLAGMGYQHFRTESIVLAEKNVPIYDLLLASRHERAAALFEKACEIRPDGQRSLFAP